MPDTATALIRTARSPEEYSEQTLAQSITELWSVHVQAQVVATKTKEELKVIRQQLGERLHAMKRLLARPGRAGQWRGFLAARGIPRSNADRYVREHEKIINPPQRCANESIDEPTEAEIGTIFANMWPSIERKLPTTRSRFSFLRGFLFRSGLSHEWRKPPVPAVLTVITVSVHK